MKQLKHLRQTLWRALLCLTVAITCWSSASAWTFTSGTTLYFKISNSTWKNDCAKFLANFNNNNTLGGTRQSLTILGNDYYSCTVPGNAGFDCVELLGMSSGTPDDGNARYYSNNFNYGPNNNQNCLELASNGGSQINISWTTYSGQEVTPPVSGGSYGEYLFNYGNGTYNFSNKDDVSNGWLKPIEISVNNNNEELWIRATDKSTDPWKYVNFKGDGVAKLNKKAESGEFVLTENGSSSLKVANTGKYQVEIYIGSWGNGPSKIKLTMLESYETPKLYVVGSWMQNGEKVEIESERPKYLDYEFTTTEPNQTFYFTDADGTIIGASKSVTFTDGQLKGTSVFTTDGAVAYTFAEPATYRIRVASYDGESTVKFTVRNLDKYIDVPNLYIGGTYRDGSLAYPNQISVDETTGKYNDFKVIVNQAGKEFRFYTELNQKQLEHGEYFIGADTSLNNGNYDQELSGSNTGDTYKFTEAGTYTISVSEYNAANKTVKFTVTREAPEVGAHLYIGGSFLGNLDDPDYQLDGSDGKFVKIQFTKNPNDGDVKFRFANAFDAANQIGPRTADNDASIELTDNGKGTFVTEKNGNTYTVVNTGVYELVVTSWTDETVNFTLTRTGDADETPYYFVGDMNDWYSTEFTNPTGTMSMQKFMKTRDAWKFRKVTTADMATAPEGVDENWYVFDKFPGKQLSDQFQITSGGSNIWNSAEVYGHGAGLASGNMWNNDSATLKNYLTQPITDDMIEGGVVFGSNHGNIDIFKRVGEGSFANFYMACNAVDNAVIYFKPGANYTNSKKCQAEIIVKGDPRHYYIFYANDADEAGDQTLQAAINSGKPNTNNYFLPGIDYNSTEIPNYIKIKENGEDKITDVSHLNYGNGVGIVDAESYKNGSKVGFVKIDNFKPNDADSKEVLLQELKAYGLDQVDAETIVNEGFLPNGRSVSEFNHLYIARIPGGFENPAGWKYNLSLSKAFNSDDVDNPVAISCNHIYFLPDMGGVSVHLHDDSFMTDQYYIQPNGEEKIYMNELEARYYYRLYYLRPTGDGEKTEVVVVDHNANGTYEENAVYNSGESLTNTFSETGDKLTYGWKALNAETCADILNNHDSKLEDEKWDPSVGNPYEDNMKGNDVNWHILWDGIEGGDGAKTKQRLRIPDEKGNCYVQILACYFKKDDNSSPLKAARANSDFTYATIDMPTAYETAIHKSIEPGELSVGSTEFHHPLRSNHFYYAFDGNKQVWTGIQNVEDDIFEQTVEDDVNAAPVYYNLQGVRVAEPTKGIFIEVRGNKSRKVMY